MRNQYEDFKNIYSKEINKIQSIFERAIIEKTLKIEENNQEVDIYTFSYNDALQEYLEEFLLKYKEIKENFTVRTEGASDIILTHKFKDKARSFRFIVDTLPKPYVNLFSIELYKANEDVHCTYSFQHDGTSFDFVTPNVDINNYFCNSTLIPFSNFEDIHRPDEYFDTSIVEKAEKINTMIKLMPDTLYEILYEGKNITTEDKETVSLLCDINIDNKDFEDIAINIEGFIKNAKKPSMKDKLKI